ncbi:MAG TPA: hypothetical protein VF546_22995 [Pyrinomonadaceae bacterium]|jgi:uncharacterized membrane protein YhdT
MPFVWPALAQSVPRFPGAYAVMFGVLFLLGLVGWLVAAVLGFTRARAFGPSTRWFALAAVCLLVFHLYLLLFAFLGTTERDMDKLLSIGSFISLFPALGALCAILGFVRLTADPRR